VEGVGAAYVVLEGWDADDGGSAALSSVVSFVLASEVSGEFEDGEEVESDQC
jgi:hypothetical protein